MTPAGPRPQRPDEDTLRLAKRLADEMFASPALAEGQKLAIEIEVTPGEFAVNFVEPARRDLRDLIGLVRKFDMPTSDVRMKRLFEIVERIGVKPEWREGLEGAEAAYQARNDVTDIRIQDLDVPPTTPLTWIAPREAFELWAYGEVVHEDYVKELRWKRLVLPAQGLVRQMAHDYLDGLLRQAAFIRRVITYGLEKPVLDPADRPASE